jgi:hypothetical protein
VGKEKKSGNRRIDEWVTCTRQRREEVGEGRGSKGMGGKMGGEEERWWEEEGRASWRRNVFRNIKMR